MTSVRRGNRIFILDSSSEDEESSDSDATNSSKLVDYTVAAKDVDDGNVPDTILVDGCIEKENRENSSGLENCMKSLNLNEKPGRSTKGRGRTPFKSQLSDLNFDSSSDDDDETDDARELPPWIRKNSKRTMAQRKSKTVIELLDTDSEEEVELSGAPSTSLNGSHVSRDETSLVSPPSSPEVFEMKTPSPCNSALSIIENEVNLDESSSCSDASEQLSIDGDNGTLWRRNKQDNYVLKGQCSLSGISAWPKMNIPKKLYDKLYDHQKSGVQFLASLYVKGVGGILGDDMGLGKTFQTCTLLGGLMRSQSISNALIVCPVAVMKNWEREARLILEKYCGLNISILLVDSSIRRERRAFLLEDALRCTPSRPHVVITSYGLVKSSRLDFLGSRKDDTLYWDYIVTDEGHQLKNPATDQHKAIARVARSPRTHRLLLTGTPIQNNMKELWALFDWATSGKLFGRQKTFLNQYAEAIEGGRIKDATGHTLRIAEKANKELQQKLRPHFLQRMKNEEFKDCLPVKKELVVWTHLSELQRDRYKNYVVDGGKVAAILTGEISSPLEAITWLKKLCDHPSLVDKLNESCPENPNELISNSSKLNVLVDLVSRLKKGKHRCLIFSPSTKMLDIMEKVLPLKLGRIDGSTKGKDRQNIVDIFNQDNESFDALLLSTKAAGVGLTLTGADRCIIYSPSWNPADDSQAVDRCYRIGQRHNVTIYRFITAGTVEEHMYTRQVAKDGIRRTLMTNTGSATERHFNKDDLKRLFHLSPKGECQMLQKVKHCSQDGPRGSSGLRSVLEKHNEVVGVSSHDSVYQNSVVNLVESEVAPFSGTPYKGNISHLGIAFKSTSRPINLESPTIPELCIPLKSASFFKGIEVEEESSPAKSVFDESIKRIETLTERGEIETSLRYLFQLLEVKKNTLQGGLKLQVHKMVVARLLYLGWIEASAF